MGNKKRGLCPVFYCCVLACGPSKRSVISQRGNFLLFFMQQPQLLAHLQDLARAVNAEIPDLRMQVHYTAVASELSGAPDASALFDAPFIQRLDALGYARARSAQPWDDGALSLYMRPVLPVN